MTDLREGIEVGQAIRPEHLLRAINALSGVTTNDIILKGSLSVEGITNITGSTIITGPVECKLPITASRLLITEGFAKIGNHVNIIQDTIFLNKLFVQNIVAQNNLTLSGSIILKDIELVPSKDTRVFLTIDQSGIIKATNGSLLEFEEKQFDFTQDILENSKVFKGKIKSLSYFNTSYIDEVTFWSKLDASPSWIEHSDINALENWIKNNISDNDIYWVKIIVKYKPFLNGKGVVVLKYNQP